VLPREELTTWLHAADLRLAPSEYEACSFALLEALSSGAPVIASRVGYMLTLIQELLGFRPLTAPPRAVEGFVHAFDALPGRGA
jgi:glycosyltransferase involved in cell wall biosynthesis